MSDMFWRVGHPRLMLLTRVLLLVSYLPLVYCAEHDSLMHAARKHLILNHCG